MAGNPSPVAGITLTSMDVSQTGSGRYKFNGNIRITHDAVTPNNFAVFVDTITLYFGKQTVLNNNFRLILRGWISNQTNLVVGELNVPFEYICDSSKCSFRAEFDFNADNTDDYPGDFMEQTDVFTIDYFQQAN